MWSRLLVWFGLIISCCVKCVHIYFMFYAWITLCCYGILKMNIWLPYEINYVIWCYWWFVKWNKKNHKRIWTMDWVKICGPEMELGYIWLKCTLNYLLFIHDYQTMFFDMFVSRCVKRLMCHDMMSSIKKRGCRLTIPTYFPPYHVIGWEKYVLYFCLEVTCCRKSGLCIRSLMRLCWGAHNKVLIIIPGDH